MVLLKKKQIVNFVFVLLIFNNIWSIFYLKDTWAGYNVELQNGWQYQMSKIIYAGVILLMIPVVFNHKSFFENAKLLSFIIILHVVFALFLGQTVEFGDVSKFFMLCLSFPFFAYALRSKFDQTLLKILIAAIALNVTNAILQANTLSSSIKSDIWGTGQGSAITIIYLLPIFFYVYKDKFSSYFYIIGAVLVFMSLRRTAIIAYLLCLPFILTRIKKNVSSIVLISTLVIFVTLVLYIVSNYWNVLQMRFGDMFEADANGSYGSGRTDWFALLFDNYMKESECWVQGAGPNMVGDILHKAGYRFRVAHSDILELLLGYGLLGLSLWFYTFYKIIVVARKRWVSPDNRKLVDMSVVSYLFISIVSGCVFNPNFMVIPIFYGLVLNKKKI